MMLDKFNYLISGAIKILMVYMFSLYSNSDIKHSPKKQRAYELCCLLLACSRVAEWENSLAHALNPRIIHLLFISRQSLIKYAF